MNQAQDISYRGMKFVEKNHMSINRVSEILEKIQIMKKIKEIIILIKIINFLYSN